MLIINSNLPRYINEHTELVAPPLKIFVGSAELKYNNRHWLICTCQLPAYITNGKIQYAVLVTPEFKNATQYMNSSISIVYADDSFQILVTNAEESFVESDSANVRYIVFGY